MRLSLKTLLRVLIAVEIVFAVGGAVLDVAFEHRLPPEFQQYASRTLEAPVDLIAVNALRFGGMLLVLLVVSAVGLWKLWRPARVIYTGCWILGLPTTLLLEDAVYFGSISFVFNEVSTFCGGMIVALIYFSDLKHQFSPSQIATSGAQPGTTT